MSNVIQIKNGASAPTTSNLQPYELGYVRGGALYINNNGTIAQLTDPKVIGLVNSNNYLKLPSVTSTTSNTGRILVADSNGIVYYKTPANIRSEIGAFSSSGGTVTGATTFNSTLTVSGNLNANNAIIVNTNSYGYSAPTIAGTNGQLYFVIIEE